MLDDSTVELDLRKIAQGDLIKLESVLESDIFEEVKFKTRGEAERLAQSLPGKRNIARFLGAVACIKDAR